MVGLPGMETTVEKVSSSTTRVSIMHFTHASMISLLCNTAVVRSATLPRAMLRTGGKGVRTAKSGSMYGCFSSYLISQRP